MLRRLFVAALSASAVPLAAQTTATLAPRPAPAYTLSLADALREARASSPAYRQALNEGSPAHAAVRSAYGALVPTFGASGGAGYTGAGQSQFGAFFNRTSPYISSSFGLTFSWTLSGRTLAAPGQQKALARAVEGDIATSSTQLRADVTTQYLTVLQATAQVEVARKQVERNTDFLSLAQARYRIGQANLLDVRQAEVTKGTSEVALLNALQRENEAKLELFRRMGVAPPAMVDRVALADSFPLSAPSYDLERLLKTADSENPALRALEARRDAAGAGVRAAKSDYLPSLQAQAGWAGFTQQFTNTNLLLQNALGNAQSGFTQCPFTNNAVDLGVAPGPKADCSPGAFGLQAGGTALTPASAQSVLNANSVFPFNFRAQPFQLNVFLQLPIWDGFARASRVARAQADRRNVDEQARARSLQVRADVTSRWYAVRTAYEATQIQARNRDAARDQLQLAQDRYRIGSGTSLELSDAQSAVARAEGDYVNAVYSYHIAIAALELAVGTPLR